MTLQISLRPELESKLREHAAAAGQSLSEFVQHVVEEKVNAGAMSLEASKLSPQEQLRRFEEWAQRMEQLVAKHVPPGHIADDSRESIYGPDE